MALLFRTFMVLVVVATASAFIQQRSLPQQRQVNHSGSTKRLSMKLDLDDIRRPFAAALAAGVLAFIPFSGAAPALAADNEVIKAQLQKLEQAKTTQQAERLQREEKAELIRDFSSKDILAKVAIRLPSTPEYPLGLEDATVLDGYGGKDSSLFVLALDKSSPKPIAAKKFLLAKVKFPVAVELTTADLLFPNTPANWEKDPRSKGPVNIVAVLDKDGLLSTNGEGNLVGLASSPAVPIAGSIIRAEGKIVVKPAETQSQYSASEKNMLFNIDVTLDKREGIVRLE
mmetsp:Transcript_20541/g.33750  ORF Transcript_20541/g.33750 Transcript_20541/m.33750 type:complete len:286 (-) Transcript_20541:473-1330(-)